MNLAKYIDTKDSGVEWLGKIPRHWSMKELKYVCTNQPSNVDKKTKEGEEVVSLCNYTDVYYNDRITPELSLMRASATDDQIQKFTLRADDVIITKDSESADDIAISTYVPENMPGVVCGYHLAMIRPTEGTCGLFIKRLFDSVYVQSKVATLANGLTRVGLSHAAVGGLELPIPPEDEQKAISSFLDMETSKIDALVSEQRCLMELLKEKRQAVISHAVTKGLNPETPMKPSGIQWLGDVPQHWKIKRLGHAGQVQNGLNIGGEAFGSGDPFVSYGDVYKNANVPEIPSGLVQSTQEDQAKFSLEVGDVLFTRTSETVDDIGVASTCLCSIPRSTFAGFLIRLRPNADTLDPRYSTYLFRNQGVQGHFSGTMNMVTRASLSQDILKMLPICIPPLGEQRMIAAFINEKVELFRDLITEAERAIELLQERRTALISAAVTGKIDVRNYQPGKAT